MTHIAVHGESAAQDLSSSILYRTPTAESR